MSSSRNSKADVNITPESKPAEVYKSDDHLICIMHELQGFFENRRFFDVTLIAKNDEVKVEAHKMILSAASKYFLGMFGGSLREATAKEVKLNQVDGHSLKMVIDFIYSGTIVLKTDTVEDILRTAHLFELNSLETLCCEFMEKQLDASNCLGISLFAEQHNCERLSKAAKAFVYENFSKVSISEEFYSLNADNLSEILSSDELRVSSEKSIFRSLSAWMSQQEEEKQHEYFEQLIHHIRFPFLTPDFIETCVEYLCNSVKSKQLILKAYKWHLLPRLRPSILPEEQIRARNFDEMMTAITGWNTSGNLSVGRYCFELTDWIYETWPGLPEGRTHFSYTSTKGKLYISGGKLESGEITDMVYSFDLKALKWKELPPLNTPRCYHKMVSLGDKLYVIGGYDGTNRLASVEKWDPLTDKFKFVCPMPQACDKVHAVATSDVLYVLRDFSSLGGKDFLYNTYDPVNDSWSNGIFCADCNVLGMNVYVKKDLIAVVSTEFYSLYSLEFEPKGKYAINLKSEYTAFKVVRNRRIIFGCNKFKEYLIGSWEKIPQLKNNQGEVVLISN